MRSIHAREVAVICCLVLAAPAADARQNGNPAGPGRVEAGPLEPLLPSIAERVVANAPAVTSGLRDVITTSDNPAGEQLARIVDTDSPRWGIRYRDGYLLFSIPARRNLSLREKQEGEKEAKQQALLTLTQKFGHLLELEDSSKRLDPKSVRVILIEPDAERSFTALLAARSRGVNGLGVAVSAPCPCDATWVALPVACGCE